MIKEMVMNRYQLMAVIEKRVDNTRMELEELRLLGPAKSDAKDLSSWFDKMAMKYSGAKDYAFGYGYMSSWLADIALKYPEVMKDLLEDPEFVKAWESLENAG
jgi:hypothetical protein